MPASPADIAKYTTDGVLLTAPNAFDQAAIRALHVDAVDGSASEIPMFFDDADDGQELLDERAEYTCRLDPPLHLGIEVEDGSALPMFNGVYVATYTTIDDETGTEVDCRLRAFALDTTSDRYSFELLQ